jgi:SAM-dependent methyltransferase
MDSEKQTLYQHDLDLTVANRERLRSNANLLYWYENLYKAILGAEREFSDEKILEIGSGTSPLKMFRPGVMTSDVLQLDYLDLVFDCHEIDRVSQIQDNSLEVISLTNVLHHLRDPIRFLRGATKKLVPGGRLIMVEPYLSLTSYPMYKTLHHEPVDLTVAEPMLDAIEGPLSSSNQALPYLIFCRHKEWLNRLDGYYDLSSTKISYYTSFSYMATGGISRRFPIPSSVYKPFFKIDRAIANAMPKLFASFFVVELINKGSH